MNNKKSQKSEKQNLSEVVVEGTVLEARANAMFDVKLDNDNVKLYEFTNSKGEKVLIRQDKPALYKDGGMQPAHFNAGFKKDIKLKQHHYYGN